MSEAGLDSDRLRERFTSPPDGSSAEPGCPDTETLVRAVRGESSRVDLETLLDHAALCPACTVAWRVARDAFLAGPGAAAPGFPGPAAVSPRAARPRRWIVAGPITAAAVLALAFMTVRLLRPPTVPERAPVYRVTGESAISSLLQRGAPLPRNRCLLRWSLMVRGAAAGGGGPVRFSVRVSDETLHPLAETHGLEREEFLVPETALATLAPGARIFWQVEAVLPDGTRLGSETFVERLE